MAMKGVNLRVGATNHTGSALTGVTKGLKGVRTAQNGVRRSNAGFMKGMSANRRIIQGVGFQLSDLSVQIAGGQSAILALTQNVPQVVQMFGAWGAMLAAFITIVGTLTLVMVKSGKGFADLAPLMGITREELAKIGAVVTKVKEAMIDFTNVVINNLDVLLISATLFGAYMGGMFVAKMIAANGVMGLFTKSLIFMKKALIKTGIGALIVAAGYLIERLFTLNKATGDWGTTFKLVGDLIKQVFIQLPNIVGGAFLKMQGFVLGLEAKFIGMLASVLAKTGAWANPMIGVFVGLFNAFVEVFKPLGAAILNPVKGGINAMIALVIAGINTILDKVNKIPAVDIPLIPPDFAQFNGIVIDETKTLAERMKDGFNKGLNGIYVGPDGALTQGLQLTADNAKALADTMIATGDKMFGAAADAIPAWQQIKTLLASVEGPKIDIRNFLGKGGVDKAMKKLLETLKDNIANAKKATGVLAATLADTNIDFSIDRIATSISKLSGIPAPKMDHILGEVDKVRDRVKSLSIPMQAEINKLNAILASDLKAVNPTEFFRSTTEIATRIQEMSIPIKAEMEKINTLHPKLEGVDISFFTGSLDTAVNKVRTTMDTVRSTVGEIHKMPPIKLPKIDTKPAKVEISKMMQFIKDLGDTIGDSMKTNMKGLITGTTSVKDALANVLDDMANKILDFAIDSLFASLSGGGAGGGIGGFFTQTLGKIFSFDGGGFTGTGSRSGGIDGKGGFAAVLHPNETVIDHTKVTKNREMGKQYDSGGGGAGVTMYTTNHFNGVTREEVMADVDKSQKDMETRMNAELPGKISKNRFNTNRGMAAR